MMDRKKVLISSTPYGGLKHNLMHLFTDVKCSPIMPSQTVTSTVDPPPMFLSSTPSRAQKTGAVRKRRIKGKDKADAPKSTTAGVLRELGVDAEELGTNALSHSRNLYNMFPEPIIIDSDDENSVIVKKPLKKCKEDSAVTQSSLAQDPEKKKRKDHVPGSSRMTRLGRAAANGKFKKQPSVKPKTLLGGIQDLKHSPKNDQVTKSKPNLASFTSTVMLDDDNSFPVYVPGTSIHRTNTRKRVKERVCSSGGLDEGFQIEWGPRQKKEEENKAEKVLETEGKAVENKEMETNNNIEEISEPIKITKNRVVRTARNTKMLNPKSGHEEFENKSVCLVSEVNEDKRVKKSIKQAETGKSSKEGESKLKHATVLSSTTDTNLANNHTVRKVKEDKSIKLSRFEDIIFKKRREGGIIARCLTTDDNDIGYIEILANEVFSGSRNNTTFVVLEGEAKVEYSGKQQTLSKGDVIYMKDSSGYEFRAVGQDHVRLLYILVL